MGSSQPASSWQGWSVGRTVVGRDLLAGRPQFPYNSDRSSRARQAPREQPSCEAKIDPLYLLHCGVLWHQQGDTGSGWELVRALRSSDRQARIISAGLLADTKDARFSAKELRRAERPPRQLRKSVVSLSRHSRGEVVGMKTPYGLEIIESCLTCKLRKDGWFCSLSSDVLRSFSATSHLSTYPGGALLFVEGQVPRGAFVLCSGKVKLSTTSREGKVLILRVAEAGEVLGLSAAVSGTCYELTAETAGPCHVNYIEREALLRLMGKNGELGMHTAQALGREFQTMYRDFHELVLARSSAGKLARLLLSWTPGREKENGANEIRIRAIMTHEEMAQMIGASRETVTRLLSELKKKEFIRLEGSTMVIRNRTALEALAA